MTNHVPTRETSKRLADSGFPQDTVFSWSVRYGEEDNYKVLTEEELRLSDDYEYLYAAPILTEILEQLPDSLWHGDDDYSLTLDDRWLFVYGKTDQKDYGRFYPGMTRSRLKHDNPAEAAALLWLDLHELSKEQAP